MAEASETGEIGHKVRTEGCQEHAGQVAAALFSVYDPEIPTLSIRDLGMVNRVVVDNGFVTIYMTPTFMGCPALGFIRTNVEKTVREIDFVNDITVVFEHDPPWTTERISEMGRLQLKEFGIAPPKCSLLQMKELTATCPYCGSDDTRLENIFGPTACRSLFHCNHCLQPFEAMKPV